MLHVFLEIHAKEFFIFLHTIPKHLALPFVNFLRILGHILTSKPIILKISKLKSYLLCNVEKFLHKGLPFVVTFFDLSTNKFFSLLENLVIFLLLIELVGEFFDQV